MNGRISDLKSNDPGVKGFTLVELAIVLVILGTIFMSVLKVESMVKNARIRQVISQYRELLAATLIYRDKYGYLPGDDPFAVAHVGATTGHKGNGDGRVVFNGSAIHEHHYAIEHLAKAGLIKGSYNGNPGINHSGFFPDTPLLHAFSDGTKYDTIKIKYDTNYPDKNSNAFQIFSLPYDVAQVIDQTLDDGVYNTGNVRSGLDYTASATEQPKYDGHSYPVGRVVYILIFFD